MFHRFHYKKNLHTLRTDGSLLFCDTCEKIIGSINYESYTDVQVAVSCSCGSTGYFQCSCTEMSGCEPVNKVPGYDNGVYICTKCDTPLFSIIKDRVNNYFFYIRCNCGEVYDTRVTHDKKLIETLDSFAKLSKQKPD